MRITFLKHGNDRMMAYSVLMLCFALLFNPTTSTAQHTTDGNVNLPSHEIGLSLGVYPIIGMCDLAHDSWFSHHDNFETLAGDTIDSWLIGSFTLNYYYNITRIHAIGLHSTVAFRHTTTFPNRNPYQGPVSPLIKSTKRGTKPYNSLNAFWSVQASYRATFKRYPVCTLYTGVSLGFTLYFMDEEWKENTPVVLPSGQLTLLGISLGRRNNGNIELGYGTQGLVKIGYSVKF